MEQQCTQPSTREEQISAVNREVFQMTDHISQLVKKLQLPGQIRTIFEDNVGVLITNYRPAGGISSNELLNAKMRLHRAKGIYNLLLELEAKLPR